MSDTPTPRTDAALVESIVCTEGGDHECTVYPAVEHVEADFARELERENAKLKAYIAALEEQCDSLGLQRAQFIAKP